MRFSLFLKGLPLALALLPGFSGAQAPAPAAASGWLSAFEGYQPFAEAPLTPWRESNDTVGRIGGWRAYAREAQGADASVPARALPPVAPGAALPAAPSVKPAPSAGHTH